MKSWNTCRTAVLSVITVVVAVLWALMRARSGNEVKLGTFHGRDAGNATANRATRVFCDGPTVSTRRCTIFNLCLDPDRRSFVFLMSNESVFHGVPPLSSSSAMLGLLDLSSMPDHNAFWLEYSPVLLDRAVDELPLVFVEPDDPVFLITAFLPGNLAHSLRDDLLPLYFTYEDLCWGDVEACADRYRLVLMPTVTERLDGSAHRRLYDVFSTRPVWNLMSDGPPGSAGSYLCFSEARVGLRKDVRYYDIGATDLDYEQPLETTTLTPRDVDRFGDFITTRLCRTLVAENPGGFPSCSRDSLGGCSSDSASAPVVIVNREASRRMLNVREVAEFVGASYSAEFPGAGRGGGGGGGGGSGGGGGGGGGASDVVEVVGLETQPLVEIICKIRRAEVVIGVHGAMLELAHFLQPGSGLVEIFPYALDPENYTPYRTICERLRTNVFYLPWANPLRENSVENPSDVHDGHIGHLAPEDRDMIRNLTRVPRLDCCNDPRFRYWLNMDTVVDLPSFSRVLSRAWRSLKTPATGDSIYNSLPQVVAEPRDVSVRFDATGVNFLVSWRPPWNVRGGEKGRTGYLVKILPRSTRVVRVFNTDETSISVPVSEAGGEVESTSYLISVEVVRSGRNRRTRRAYMTVVV